MDNVFTFWEMSAIAQSCHEDLAILFLDFEKAYDKVDWSFLHEVMLRMGFSQKWMKGIVALYLNAHSRLLLSGDVEQCFQLSCSAHQGCPLAPYYS